MPSRTSIRVGNVVYGGQEPENGVTMTIDAAAQVGDVVTSDTTPKAVRGASGAVPIGVVVTKEADNLGSVQSFENVQVVAVTGTVILGTAGLQCNGDGTAKLVAAGTASSVLVLVYGSQTINSVVYAAMAKI